MIRSILKYKLFPGVFLADIPQFIQKYCQTRTLRFLLLGLPSALISVLIAGVWFSGESTGHADLFDHYVKLTSQVIEESNFKAAEVYFTRQLQLTQDRQKTIFNYGQRLWDAGGGQHDDRWHLLAEDALASADSPIVRSLQLMETIAPREAGRKGYADAHLFLARYWETRREQNDLSLGLVFQHRSASEPHNLALALDFANFLSSRGHFEPAIHVLNPFHNDPVAKMAMSGFQTLNGELQTGKRLLNEAVTELADRLQSDPNNVELRLQLSRAQAAQRRYLQSMLVLVDGCSEGEPPPLLVDALIRRCVHWLQHLPPNSSERQLKQLSSLLCEGDESTTAELVFSSGEAITLPTPLVRLQHALLAGDGRWIVPLLIGTDLAAQERYPEARVKLNEALAVRPKQSHAMNNLAWVCYKLAEAAAGESTEATGNTETSKLVDRAWDLANRCVKAEPNNLSFRQTRATVALSLQEWQTAASDSLDCIAGGYDTDNSRLLLAEAQQGLDSEAAPADL